MTVLMGGTRITLTAPIASFQRPGHFHEPGTPGVLVQFIGTVDKEGLDGRKHPVQCWTADLDTDAGTERVELLNDEFTPA